MGAFNEKNNYDSLLGAIFMDLIIQDGLCSR